MAYSTRNRARNAPTTTIDEPEPAVGGCGRPHVAVVSSLIGIRSKMDSVKATVVSMCIVVNIVFCAAKAAVGLPVTDADVNLLKPSTLRRKCEGDKYKSKGKKKTTHRIRSIMGMPYQFLCKTAAVRTANRDKVKAVAKAYGCDELVESLASIVSGILESKSAEIKVLKKAKPTSAVYKRALASVQDAAAAAVKGLVFSDQDIIFLAAMDASELTVTHRASGSQCNTVQPSLDAEDDAPVPPTPADASEPTAVAEAMDIDAPVQIASDAVAAASAGAPAEPNGTALADLDGFDCAVLGDGFDVVADLLPVDPYTADYLTEPGMFQSVLGDVSGPACDHAPSATTATNPEREVTEDAKDDTNYALQVYENFRDPGAGTDAVVAEVLALAADPTLGDSDLIYTNAFNVYADI